MSAVRDKILQEARARLGVPYRIDPPPDGVNNLDCSLYVLQVAASSGVPYKPGVRTAEEIRRASPSIAYSDVKPGDLLFFENTYDAAGIPGEDGKIASHIGISLGSGTFRMLNSLSPLSAETNIGTAYWQSHLLSAGRIPGVDEAETGSSVVVTGIDVSNHQGTINWSAVSGTDIEFVFIKASEGLTYRDPYFKRNWDGAKKSGLIRGAYHFGNPNEGTDPVKEAQFFLKVLSDAVTYDEQDMLVLDLERPDDDGTGAEDWALTFLEAVEEETAQIPLLYTGDWVTNFAKEPKLARYPLWLAAYQATPPACPPPWKSYAFWQYSDEGNIGGINPCDMNLYRGIGSITDFVKSLDLDDVPGHDYAVGDGILKLMEADGTEPMADSTFLPLGANPAQLEEGYAANGNRYVWNLTTGKHFRYKPN